MPTNEIVVRLRVGGVDEVTRGLRTVEQAAERAEQRTRKQYDNETRVAQKASREKLREKEREERAEARVRETSTREASKAASNEAKATEKAHAEKIRSEEKWANQRARIQETSAKLAYKLANDEVRAVERAESEKQRIRERHARAIGNRAGSIIGGSIGGLAHGAVRLAGTAAMLGGGFSIADVVQQQFAAQRQAAQLVNAVTSSGAAPAGANVNDIMKQASGVAISTGMSKADVIGGALAYSRSARGGNFAGAMGNMEFFAKLSKTTGTSIEDLGSAAGILQSQNAELGKNPALMRQMLLNAYSQSKSGSVSLREAAKQFGVLGSTRGLFQSNEAKNQMTLLGLGQIAAAGGSSEEIGTYIKDFSTEIAQKRMHTSKEIGLGGRGLESLGVHFDKTGRMESPEQAIGAIFKATGGDLGKIAGIVHQRGLPLFSELQKSFLGAGGGDAGVKAVTSQIQGVTQSTMTEKDLNQQFSQVMDTTAERFDKAKEKLIQVLEEKLTPYLERFADHFPEWEPKIEKFIDAIAKGVDWFMEHPFEGLGAIVAGKIVLDLGKAAIGEAVKKSLISLISPGGGGVVPTGGGGATPSGGVSTGTATTVAVADAVLANAEGDYHADVVKKLGAGQKQAGFEKWLNTAIGVANPLALASDFAIDYAADTFGSDYKNKGKITPGEKYAGKSTADIANDARMQMDEQRKQTALLKDISSKLGPPGNPNAPHRNQSLSSPARGGTQ